MTPVPDPAPRGLTRRVKRIKISETKRMPMLAAEVGGCVSLGQGVPSFATPEFVVDAVCAALRTDPAAGKYTLQPGLPELRRAVAAMLARDKGLAATPGVEPTDEVAITVGAMEALLMAMLTLVQKGDEVLVPEPYYPSHVEQILLAGGEPVFAPLDRAAWELDVDALRKIVTRHTKLVLVSSPHNPTGAVWSEATLRDLAAFALDHDLWVLCDDTYDALAYDGRPAFSLASVPELAPRLILVSSFSKRYALTGWRVGYARAPKRLLDEMLKVHDATTICAPAPSQLAALAALNGPQEVFDGFRLRLEARRDLCCRRLDELGEAVSYVRPAGAFYVMLACRFSREDSQALAERVLREARVITIPGGAFGPGGQGHLRLSFGGDEAELNEAFDRLAAWIARQ
ncbi:MAG: pyridoxal phosphate-dependent aminotransferase [Desulfovibrionaceae bacterium]